VIGARHFRRAGACTEHAAQEQENPLKSHELSPLANTTLPMFDTRI
jgi:hypothetical protein